MGRESHFEAVNEWLREQAVEIGFPAFQDDVEHVFSFTIPPSCLRGFSSIYGKQTQPKIGTRSDK